MWGNTDNIFPVDFICNVQYFQYSAIIYIEVLSHVLSISKLHFEMSALK